MNSYPHEFLAHPQPLMFVAGLSEGSASSQPSQRDRSSSIISTSSRRASHGAASLEPHVTSSIAALSLTSPLTSPGPSSSALPQSPPIEELLEPAFSQELDDRDKDFNQLLENLRGALKANGEKGKIWVSGPETKAFRILLVDKGVRLPLRKIAAPVGSPDTSPHSPLSPLVSSSPVYPDGLIAPIWVRKHAELVPSVFVLFLRLYESPNPPESESAQEKEQREKRDKEMEKEKDDLLVKEIGDRRRRLGERGIKLTVVLMASSATLDSPNLDPRLSYLRRASQLSAKASLFVLTPVPADQLPDFVQSLQDALYESAMEYYGSHAKRVRRKRARLSTGQFAVSQGLTEKGKSLGAQGWGVRYDWKLGWFAELRGEFDVARRHYEDCWNELARMFASTQTLPPRTKRWAEAKVLADCVAVRICRLLLYEGEAARITIPFFVHVKRFSDLSRGWGIGEDTFEYWSWIARQYRIFAELLEMALQSGLRLPSLPLPIFPVAGPAHGAPTLEHWATPISSLNPTHALQPPAVYFYTAAMCSVQRQKRYEQALEVEQDALGSEAGSASGYVSTAPGFANEKKVDHAGIIIELFTKAYTLTKEQAHARDHAALHVAFKIAETYCKSGQNEMAMKFFERISPTFKADQWNPIVRQIRALWYECAQITGHVETATKLLFEMMCPNSGVEGEERASLQEDLMLLLRTTKPSSDEPLIINMDTKSLRFWEIETILPASAPLQVVLSSTPGVDISTLSFSELHLSFSDNRPVVKVKSNDQAVTSDRIDLGIVGRTEVSAPLKWSVDGELVLTGQLESEVEEDVQVSAVTLVLKERSWEIHLVFAPEELIEWSTSKRSLTPVNQLSSIVSFVSRAHDVELDVQHHPSAYVDELLPLRIKTTNSDDRALSVQLSVFLQSADEEHGSLIKLDEKESSSSLENIDLGTLSPGETVERIVYLISSAEGTTTIDCSIFSTVEGGQAEEKVHTAVIPILQPFQVTSTVTYEHKSISEGVAVVHSVIRANGPRDIVLEALSVGAEDDSSFELLSHSIGSTKVPEKWNSSMIFSVFTKFAIKSSRRPSGTPPFPPGHLLFEWKSEGGEMIENRVALPMLILPTTESFISATLSSPSSATLHEPFRTSLTLLNSHPTNTSRLNIEITTADAFVWRGERSSLMSLQPGEKREIDLEVVCVGTTGRTIIPKVMVWEVRGPEDDMKREIKVKGDSRVFIRP